MVSSSGDEFALTG